MELYKEILSHALMCGEIPITFTGKDPDIASLMESKCYQSLQKIKDIIQDDSLSDNDCFDKIEEILCALEDIGSTGGSRHDFG